jgi:hypothetical protein
MPIRKQWSLVKNAREVVAIHGASMHALAFNRHGLARQSGDLSGLKVIEIFPSSYCSDYFRRLACVMNAHWCAVRGQITVDVVRELEVNQDPKAQAFTDFHVDLETLALALDFSAAAEKPEHRPGRRTTAMASSLPEPVSSL